MKTRVVAAVAAVLLPIVLSVSPAFAQTAPQTPSPAPAPKMTVPPAAINVVTGIITRLAGEAAAPYNVDPNHNRGTVTYFRRFDLQIRMPLNNYRDIHLHQGTVINPRGASIEPGQVVDVVGHAQGDGSLDADTITIVH
jgi:hypothetical protein